MMAQVGACRIIRKIAPREAQPRGRSHPIPSKQGEIALLVMKYREGSAYLLDIIVQRLTQRLLVVVVAGHVCVN